MKGTNHTKTQTQPICCTTKYMREKMLQKQVKS